MAGVLRDLRHPPRRAAGDHDEQRPGLLDAGEHLAGALGHRLVGADERAVEVGRDEPRGITAAAAPCDAAQRGQQLRAPGEVRTQRLGHVHRPVGALVHLEQHGDRAADGAQRAVERRDRRQAVVAAGADAEPAGLEVGAVARRGQLEPALLRRQPGLAVVLASGRRPEIACSDVDDAERQLEHRQERHLVRQQPQVLLLGLREVDVGEHLDLVELVDADDAAGVLAVAAGLAPEARREAGVAQRQLVEHLARVVRRERHLRRADEVEVVVGELVDLVGVRAEEAGALHRLGTHERGRDDRREAGLDRRRHRQVDERQLEQRAPAGEEREAAAADLGAALGVDRAERRADVEVVLDREVVRRHLADGLQHDEVLLAAGRDAVDHDVGDGEVRGAQRGLGLGLRRLGRLDLGRERLGPLEDRRALLLRRPSSRPATPPSAPPAGRRPG